MGTRADFYLGRGTKAKWLGSIGWNGYPSGIPDSIKNAKTQREFLQALQGFSLFREDWTPPEHGWPWPWEDSGTTDYAYAFDDGKVWASGFGSPWFEASKKEPEDTSRLPGRKATFPDMSKIERVTFGRGSGIITLGGPPPEERLDPVTGKVEIRGRAGTRPGKTHLTKRRPGDVAVRTHVRRRRK